MFLNEITDLWAFPNESTDLWAFTNEVTYLWGFLNEIIESWAFWACPDKIAKLRASLNGIADA